MDDVVFMDQVKRSERGLAASFWLALAGGVPVPPVFPDPGEELLSSLLEEEERTPPEVFSDLSTVLLSTDLLPSSRPSPSYGLLGKNQHKFSFFLKFSLGGEKTFIVFHRHRLKIIRIPLPHHAALRTLTFIRARRCGETEISTGSQTNT